MSENQNTVPSITSATDYAKRPFKEQFDAVCDYIDDMSDADTLPEDNKFYNDVCSQRGAAMKRANVSATAWKTSTVIPVKVRADYPALIAFAAMEASYLASFAAVAASKWVTAATRQA